jgi:hypothetical protein
MTASDNEALLAQLKEINTIIASFRRLEDRIIAVEQLRDGINAVRTKPNRTTRVQLALEMIAAARQLVPDLPIVAVSSLQVRRLLH